MGKRACENTHPDQEEVLNPPRDEEKQYKCATSKSIWRTSNKCRCLQKTSISSKPCQNLLLPRGTNKGSSYPKGGGGAIGSTVDPAENGQMGGVERPSPHLLLSSPPDSSPHGMGRKCRHVQRLLAPLCVVLSLLVVVLLVALIVVQLQSRSSHPPFSHVCPDTWIGFQGKCYYFSENKSNWNTSLENCKALEASLTSIDSLDELTFIKHYKGQANHWFGLHKEGNGQWRWTSGTAFNTWFEMWGGGDCAYLNQERISSALCHTEKYWICSRPNNYVEWRQKIYPE